MLKALSIWREVLVSSQVVRGWKEGKSRRISAIFTAWQLERGEEKIGHKNEQAKYIIQKQSSRVIKRDANWNFET